VTVERTKIVEGYEAWKQAIIESAEARNGIRVEFVHRIHGTIDARMIQSEQSRNSQPIQLGAFTPKGHGDYNPNSGWYYC